MGDHRPTAARRWKTSIIEHLEDFPRQLLAMEVALGQFGEDFDLAPFKLAYETTTDFDSYNRVQAAERAAGRVQSYVETLAIAGCNLAGLEHTKGHASEAVRAFDTLREAGVISSTLCRHLSRAHGARNALEHGYVNLPAGNAHRGIELIHSSSLMFIAVYPDWVRPLLRRS